MAITVDYQGEIRGLTVGALTPYRFSGPVTGLGIPGVRSADQERGDLDGDVGGDDVLLRRILYLPLGIEGTSPSDAWVKLQALKRAWRRSPVDVALDLRLPGFPTSDGIFRFYGRPRGLVENLELLRSGEVGALCTFEALDPYAYGPEETVALSAGVPVDVTNDGDGISDRYTLTLTGGGGNVTFANASDSEPALALVGAGGDEVLDGRARTITAGGSDAYGLKAPGAGWPVLESGVNALTLTGATGSLTFRPAWT